jgi:hypothetical protein
VGFFPKSTALFRRNDGILQTGCPKTHGCAAMALTGVLEILSADWCKPFVSGLTAALN